MSNTICPLLTITSCVLPSPEGKNECEQSRCAWWLEEYIMPVNGVNTVIPGRCAIKQIGSAVESMVLDGVPINQ